MKSIKFFSQSTEERSKDPSAGKTCGICCMLMALKYYHLDYPSRGKESAYYSTMHCHAAPGTLASRIAQELGRRGLDVTLTHASEALLEDPSGFYASLGENKFEKVLTEYKQHIDSPNRKFSIQRGVPVTCESIADELNADPDRLVIAQCFAEIRGSSPRAFAPHCILIYDFDGEKFYICDPAAAEKSTLTIKEMDEYLGPAGARVFMTIGGRN